jgi:hypothetical protein
MPAVAGEAEDGMSTKNLHNAKRAKNDEFYTQLPDIEKELKYYTQHFKDKVVYCNCDAEWSNFAKFFTDNFESLGIKKFIHSSGDFRSAENIESLKEADIVVTNPPFSLFRDFVEVLMEYEKKFLIIGPQNAITYKIIFNLIKNGKLWLGNNKAKEFLLPDGTKQIFGNICWFTNLDHKRRNKGIICYKKYSENEFPKYDNYDAIEVNKVSNIPVDYCGVMGVPISFLDKFNPAQFELLGCSYEYGKIEGHHEGTVYATILKGKSTYKRLFIRHRLSTA